MGEYKSDLNLFETAASALNMNETMGERIVEEFRSGYVY